MSVLNEKTIHAAIYEAVHDYFVDNEDEIAHEVRIAMMSHLEEYGGKIAHGVKSAMESRKTIWVVERPEWETQVFSTEQKAQNWRSIVGRNINPHCWTVTEVAVDPPESEADPEADLSG